MKKILSVLAISSLFLVNSSYAQLMLLVPGYQPEKYGKLENIPATVQAQDAQHLKPLLKLVKAHKNQGTLQSKQKIQFQDHWTALKDQPVRHKLGNTHKVSRNLALNRTSSSAVLDGAAKELSVGVQAAQAKS